MSALRLRNRPPNEAGPQTVAWASCPSNHGQDARATSLTCLDHVLKFKDSRVPTGWPPQEGHRVHEPPCPRALATPAHCGGLPQTNANSGKFPEIPRNSHRFSPCSTAPLQGQARLRIGCNVSSHPLRGASADGSLRGFGGPCGDGPCAAASLIADGIPAKPSSPACPLPPKTCSRWPLRQKTAK